MNMKFVWKKNHTVEVAVVPIVLNIFSTTLNNHIECFMFMLSFLILVASHTLKGQMTHVGITYYF